jgi:hypothetical protein
MARVLDELRGGNRGHQSERDALKRIRASWPQASEAVARYDRLASDAAMRAVADGATAVVFGAQGFPGPGDPPHKAAADANPARPAMFFYSGSNGVIAALRGRSLGDDVRAMVLAASVTEPGALLEAIELQGAGGGPYMIQLGLAVGFMRPAKAAAALAAYGETLPPRSRVLAAVPDGPDGRRLAMLGGAQPHSPDDVAGWLLAAGFDLGPEASWGGCPASGGRIVAISGRLP